MERKQFELAHSLDCDISFLSEKMDKIEKDLLKISTNSGVVVQRLGLGSLSSTF